MPIWTAGTNCRSISGTADDGLRGFESHYYRQWWYWGGEAALRVNGPKMQLTAIPDSEWDQVEAAAMEFWDEIAAESETKAKVVGKIFKEYNADHGQGGPALSLWLIRFGNKALAPDRTPGQGHHENLRRRAAHAGCDDI